MWKFLLPVVGFIALAVMFAFGLNLSRFIHGPLVLSLTASRL